MEHSIGERRLNIRSTEKDRARLMAVADDRHITAADLYRRMLFGRVPKRGMKHAVDIAMIAELIRQGANLRSLYNELGRRGKWHSDLSATLLKKIGEAVRTMSPANEKFMAGRRKMLTDIAPSSM